MNKKVVVIGAGGHAKVVIDIILQKKKLGEKYFLTIEINETNQD